MKGRIIMKIKKIIKNLTLATALTMSLSLSTNAVKPTILQLESFYAPFELLYSKSITFRYPNIKYLVGLEALKIKVKSMLFVIGETPHPVPAYFSTLRDYESYLINYTKTVTKLFALDEQIDSLRNILLRETSILSPDTPWLLEYYEQLATILSTSDCNEFVEKAKPFIELWGRNIKENSRTIGESSINPNTEKFIEAQTKAKEHFELYLDQLREKDENDI